MKHTLHCVDARSLVMLCLVAVAGGIAACGPVAGGKAPAEQMAASQTNQLEPSGAVTPGNAIEGGNQAAMQPPIEIGDMKLTWHLALSDADITIIDARIGLIDITTDAVIPMTQALYASIVDASDQTKTVVRARMVASGDGAPHKGKPTTRYVARLFANRAIDGLACSVFTLDPQNRVAKDMLTGPIVKNLSDVTNGKETAQHVPTWALGATWYQIFPERFRNAVASNDPQGPNVFLAEWRSDWYSVQPGELAAWQSRRRIDAKAFKPHPQGELYNVIWDRRYGGDLQGVLEKLSYMKEVGINAIYFNPIFEAQSLHKYDASDFRHIDQRLANPAGVETPPQDGTYVPASSPTGGTQEQDPKSWAWTPADRWFIDEFLPAAKKAGIRVILDGVWNHTGREFWAFQDIVKNGQKSAYADWYICEFDVDGKLSGWSGWDGKNGYLPEFRQVKGGLDRDRDKTVEKGDLNAGVKQHVFDVTRRWMDPNNDGDPSDGIDGWRLDVAGEVGQEFWREWRGFVKKLNPQAITIAEIWGDATDWIGGGSFDTQMHYPFAFPVLDWLRNMNEAKQPVGSEQLAKRLETAFNDKPHANLLHQNLFASHDTDRYVNILWNPGRGYDRDCAVQDGASNARPNDPKYVPYKAGKPPEEIYRLSILGLAIQATYQGSPMIYYGDEIGMWGADDPTCRKPYPWNDAPALTKGSPAKSDEQPIAWVHEEYKRWLNMRGASSPMQHVLRYGNVQHIATGREDVFAFERRLNNQRVVVVVNRGSTPFEASLLLGTASVRPVAPLSAEAWLQ